MVIQKLTVIIKKRERVQHLINTKPMRKFKKKEKEIFYYYIAWQISSLSIVASILQIVTTNNLCLKQISISILLLFSVISIFFLYFKKREHLPELCKGPYNIKQSTKDDIIWAAEKAKEVYKGKLALSFELLQRWYNHNPNGFSIIKDCNGRNCGNIHIIPLKNDFLEKMINGNVQEKDISITDIYNFNEKEKIESIYIVSIVIDNDKGHGPAIHKALSQAKEIISRIATIHQIKRIYAMGVSKSGKSIMDKLGFTVINDNKMSYVDIGDFLKNSSKYEHL